MKLLILLLAFPLLTFAQSKDCKFEKLTDPKTGKFSEVIYSPTMIGKLTIGKTEGKKIIFYSPKALFAASAASNQVNLKIDSLQFIFSDLTTITIKAQGIGTTSNAPQLKPQYISTYGGAEISEEQLKLFQTKEITAFMFKGEKDSEGGDALSKKQGANLLKVFNCLN